ncbi:hypothetical protein J4419_05490 [Candidatus Woesearchaeota archaeon]|nr:hypothetical protein [Candidatus Woesearchaeota archaeon]
MKYESTLLFRTDKPDEMLSILQHEVEDRERTKLNIKKAKGSIEFAIAAADATALKAEFNRVLKALMIIEKAEHI